MAKDDKGVQPDEVPEGTELPEGETKPEDQPSDEERITQLVKDEVARQTNGAKREIQGVKDKAKAEVVRERDRAQSAEDTLADYDKGFEGVDPEQASRIKAEARLKGYERRDREGVQRQAAEQAVKDFEGSLTEHIKDLGLDPDDDRLDWGKDLSLNTPGYFYTRQNKFLKSVAKITKEVTKAADDKRSQEFKDLEARLRKDLGIDSVPTEAPGGAAVKDWRKMSPEQRIRAGLKEGQRKGK